MGGRGLAGSSAPVLLGEAGLAAVSVPPAALRAALSVSLGWWSREKAK